MYCENCGVQITDGVKFCEKCGARLDYAKPVETTLQVNSSLTKANSIKLGKLKDGLGNYIPILGAVSIMVSIITILILYASSFCDLSNCKNSKIEDSDYCKLHTCSYPQCTYSKSQYDNYCFIHEAELCCDESDCTRLKIKNGNYCSYHTCEKNGCYSKKFWDSNYCVDHQIDMREMLTHSGFNFKLNSAGGIVFNFEARNETGRKIKYVRFKVYLYNAVNDRITDDIRHEYALDVEIIGPVSHYGKVEMNKEIIGYCDNCAKIEIKDITIIYEDGTSETGRFNYYYEL